MHTAFLFAAGLGTRLKPITERIPKSLVQVRGVPLIEYSIRWALEAGVTHFLFNAHHLAVMMTEYLEGLQPRGVIPLHCKVTILQEPQLLETGGALYAALPMIDEPSVFAVNTDLILRPAEGASHGDPLGIEGLKHQWDAARMDALLLTYPTSHAVGFDGGDYGVLPDPSHPMSLQQIHWGTAATRSTMEKPVVYVGVQRIACAAIQAYGQAYTDTIIAPKKRFSTRDIWLSHLSPEGVCTRAFAMSHPGYCFQVSTAETLDQIEKIL